MLIGLGRHEDLPACLAFSLYGPRLFLFYDVGMEAFQRAMPSLVVFPRGKITVAVFAFSDHGLVSVFSLSGTRKTAVLSI